MAKGKATPSSFKPGDPRAVACGRKSSRALPPDLKEARKLRLIEFQQIIFKYLDCSIEQLTQYAKNPETTAKDLLVLKVLKSGLENGDLSKINFLLDRSIGKVPDEQIIDASVNLKTLHDTIIEEIENDDK